MEHRIKLREPVAASLSDTAMIVESLAAAGHSRLVLDAAGIQDFDPFSLNLLVRLNARCRELRLRLALQKLTPAARGTIVQAGVAHLFSLEGREPPSFDTTST